MHTSIYSPDYRVHQVYACVFRMRVKYRKICILPISVHTKRRGKEYHTEYNAWPVGRDIGSKCITYSVAPERSASRLSR